MQQAAKAPNFTKLLIKHRWIWHLAYWGFYGASRAIPYYITVMYYDAVYLQYMLICEVPLVILTYLTVKMYTHFVSKGHYKNYLILGLIAWVAYVCFIISFQKYYLASIPSVANTHWFDLFLNRISQYIITFVLLTMAKYFKDNFIHQYYENEQKHLQIQSELQNLKAQISPHFLFNTMNNFYGLAVEQSKKLPELMVRLSDLLRYTLYESNNATVPITKEIEYLKNYIELEKIRLEDSLVYEFDLKIPEHNAFEIAPLIFLVFVENAFKHAKNVKNEAINVKIALSIPPSGMLTFDVKNNYLKEKGVFDHEKSGIGLENVKKRLEALYPNGLHELVVIKTEDYFQVHLRINLMAK